MNDVDMMRERLSALADGEVQDDDFADAVAYAGTPEGESAWHMYHLIGDTLRGPAPLAMRPTLDPQLLVRLRPQLAQEPHPAARAKPVLVNQAVIRQGRGEAANASVFRWRLAAGFASLAAVVAVGWNNYSSDSPPAGGAAPQLAQLPAMQQQPAADWPPPFVATSVGRSPQSPIMIRDPRLDALLAAHKQYGNTTSLQMPASFLRNADFAAPGR